MPTSAVVDTSVLVSAFLFPESIPGRVVSLAEEGVYALLFSPIILEETRRSLRNPRLRDSYGHTDDAINTWCTALHDIGTLLTVPLPDIGRACRDPDDDHVIAAALAARAVYIVTGDRDLLALGRYEHIRIITARRFLDEVTTT
jgi:putative PIN family toxin of toxin-antitoxin system